MLFIRGPDQANNISDPDLRDLVALRFLEIVDGDTYDPDIHGEMIVAEPGDTAATLEEQSGCPILTNPFDEARYGVLLPAQVRYPPGVEHVVGGNQETNFLVDRYDDAVIDVHQVVFMVRRVQA